MIKLLAVDDDPVQLRLYQRILADRHYSVALAHNEPRALRLMEKEKPVVVICDLKLLDGDGFELLGKLRQIDQDAGFMIITGYGSPDRFNWARRLGVHYFLEKPLQLRHFVNTVCQLAYQKQLERTRARLRVCHTVACPFGSCLLKGEDSCSSPECPYSHFPS